MSSLKAPLLLDRKKEFARSLCKKQRNSIEACKVIYKIKFKKYTLILQLDLGYFKDQLRLQSKAEIPVHLHSLTHKPQEYPSVSQLQL